MKRTHNCGELTSKNDGQKVILCGWVDSIRIHGKIGFISIRDRYGITQLFLNEENSKKVVNLKKESVIMAVGEVKKRPDKLINKDMVTGEIEVSVSKIEILNESNVLPLELSGEVESTDETRLKYRFLDLRRKKMQDNLVLRHKISKALRDFLDKESFLEIETPILAKSTPEGARDYLVPSRVYKGEFFALPQSPQLFKQLLMIAGYDKYFQIVKCFRDEDLRADRQPEFTQIDMEMSFVEVEDILDLNERMLKYVFKQTLGIDLKIPFERITYQEAQKKYKTDKPDLRGKNEKFKFLWVVDFPLFTMSQTEHRIVSEHHPFTSPKDEDLRLLEKEPLKVRSQAYDLVLNGFEIGSGSIRITNVDMQNKIFKVLGLSQKEIDLKFGFLIEALSYGAPPMGGIALGLDRICAIVSGYDSIREVIAFPKNKDSRDLMLDAPSKVDENQLKELGIKLK